MQVAGSRVAIVGGSIAGCAAALALGRSGADVEVYERSSGALRDRGSGIAIPIPLRDDLIDKGYLDADYAHCSAERRWWVLADGSPGGRILWGQPGTAALNNWGVLWCSLRSRVADAQYHDGISLESFTPTHDGVTIGLSDGTSREVDVLVGADGYRSAIRRRIVPDARLEYSGYILWRGNCPEGRLDARAAIDRGDVDRHRRGVPRRHARQRPRPEARHRERPASAGRVLRHRGRRRVGDASGEASGEWWFLALERAIPRMVEFGVVTEADGAIALEQVRVPGS